MPKQEELTLDNIDEMIKTVGSNDFWYVDSLNTMGKHYYPVNSVLWKASLGHYTEEQLAKMGIIKTDYLVV